MPETQGGPTPGGIEEVYYPVAAKGYDPLAPPMTLTPSQDFIWRSCKNVIERDGVLQKRPSLTGTLVTQPGSEFASYVAGATATKNKGEIPVYIYSSISPTADTNTTTAGACITEYDYAGGGKMLVVVTTRNAYVSRDGGTTWTTVTPTYTTGTVAVTNGSKNVTGTGTSWATFKITGLQFITIGGVVYQICTVVDDTHLTLTTNFAGSTASGLSYTITRSWSGGTSLYRKSLIFCQVFNQDLYIAGSFLGRADGKPEPCVIKVTNLLSGTLTTTYLTAASALVSGLDNIASLVDISGLQLLQDGRVVFTGNESTLYYSSHLNTAVWNASPGGFTYVTQRSGPIHAMGQNNNRLTLHYEDGIVLGTPTGEADPPLSFQPTSARVGCFAPRTLKSIGSVERFLGADLNVHEFSGGDVTTIGNSVRADLVNFNLLDIRSHAHAAYDAYRNEYILFYENTPNTSGWIYQADTQRWWPQQWPAPIGTMSDRDDTSANRLNSRALVGIPNYSTSNGATFNMILGYTDVATYDAQINFTGSTTGGIYADTDDIDLGDPESFKSVHEIRAWVDNVPLNTGSDFLLPNIFRVKISYDQGRTWTTLAGGAPLFGALFQQMLRFFAKPANTSSGSVGGYPNLYARIRFVLFEDTDPSTIATAIRLSRFKIMTRRIADGTTVIAASSYKPW